MYLLERDWLCIWANQSQLYINNANQLAASTKTKRWTNFKLKLCIDLETRIIHKLQINDTTSKKGKMFCDANFWCFAKKYTVAIVT